MKKLETPFEMYDLQADEVLAAAQLSDLQRANIQTKLSTTAMERINLIPDPKDYTVFIQSEAHFKGRMDALQEILREDEDARVQLMRLNLESRQENASSNHNPAAPGYSI